MTLGQLIAALKQLPPDKVVKHGFTHAHSYRGYYDQVAFEPAEDVTVASMLAECERALCETFHGWKGGEYRYEEYTDAWLAEMGCCGEQFNSASVREWSA